MSGTTRTTRSRLLALPALTGAVAVLTLLAACSDEPAQLATTDPTAEAAQGAGAGSGDGELPGGGGVTGEIAAVADAVLQVQGDDGQTAVSWDDTTTITQTVTAALSDITVGSCVVAVGAGDDGTAATSVTISTAVDGGCTGGFGGGMPGGGEMPEDGGMPSGMPSGAPGDQAPGDGEQPSGMPTDRPDGASGGGFGGVTAGLVTAVDGSTITVESAGFGDDAETTTATVTVDDATTYTTTADADATAITVGRCVVAQGESDDSGKVAATSLALSDAGDDGCSTGFGGRGGMPGGQGGGDDQGEAADA